jgi:phosphate uptake regulator
VKRESEIRKLQLTGGSTYIISLPKWWISNLGLKPGDEVELIVTPSLKLMISPRWTRERMQRETVISSEGHNIQSLIREIIANYIAGIDTVKIMFSKIDHSHELKEIIRRRLLGSEVVEESHDYLTFQFLISERDLSIDRSFRRMGSISCSLLRDVYLSIIERKKDYVMNMYLRDDEVDRFYFYIMRLLSLSTSDPEIIESNGYRLNQIPELYSVAKSIERVSDHAIRIASIVQKEEVEEDIGLSLKDACDLFSRSLEIFYEKDKLKASQVMLDIDETYSKRSSEIVKKNVLIAESFNRVLKYSKDIIESTIDIVVKGQKLA